MGGGFINVTCYISFVLVRFIFQQELFVSASLEGLTKTGKLHAAYGDAQALTGRKAAVSLPERSNQPAADQVNLSPSTDVGDYLRDMQDKRQADSPFADLNQLVDETNSSLEANHRSLRFRINKDSDELQIQVVDASRDRVIRSIPSDEMIALAARIRELSGVGAMVDHSR